MLVVDLGLVLYMRYNIATEEEIDEVYGKILWALGYLVIGFFFYATHAPECFLIKCFGKKKSSRPMREAIQLICPSHALWHIGVFGNGYGLFWAIYLFNKHVEMTQE